MTYSAFQATIDAIDRELSRLDSNSARDHSRRQYLLDKRARLVADWQEPAES